MFSAYFKPPSLLIRERESNEAFFSLMRLRDMARASRDWNAGPFKTRALLLTKSRARHSPRGIPDIVATRAATARYKMGKVVT